jgi:hypothetical protein
MHSCGTIPPAGGWTTGRATARRRWSPAWHHRVERDAARAGPDDGRPGTDHEIVGGHRENAGYFGPLVPAVRIDRGARAMLSTEQLYTKMHAFTGDRYLLHAFL